MRVAVIDIGSNTVKILVADAMPAGVFPVAETAEDVRLSPRADEPPAGISERAAGNAIAAIMRLVEFSKKYSPAKIRLVATSIVRDAGNGAAFRARVYQETGYGIDVLSGDAEARGIAAGVATDPALAGKAALRIVDLGGGSLEFIEKDAGGDLLAVESVPLGAVRLTRRFFPNPENPIPPAQSEQLAEFVREMLSRVLQKSAGTLTPFVGTGGAFSVARAIFAERAGIVFDASSPVLPVPALENLRDELLQKTLTARTEIPALPAARADILPAALATICVAAKLADVREFVHSRRNLRYGIAAACAQT